MGQALPARRRRRRGVLVQRVKELLEASSADVVNHQRNGAAGEGGVERFAPVGVVRGEGEASAVGEQDGVLGGVAREGDGDEAHRMGELEAGDADAARRAGDEHDRAGVQRAELGEGLVGGEVHEGSASALLG